MSQSELKVVPLNEDEARAIALQIYCTQGVVHFQRIADRIGYSKQQVMAWSKTYRWADIKYAQQKQNRERFTQLIGDAQQRDVETIQYIQAAKQEAGRRLQMAKEDKISAQDLKLYLSIISESDELIEDIAARHA